MDFLLRMAREITFYGHLNLHVRGSMSGYTYIEFLIPIIVLLELLLRATFLKQQTTHARSRKSAVDMHFLFSYQ